MVDLRYDFIQLFYFLEAKSMFSLQRITNLCAVVREPTWPPWKMTSQKLKMTQVVFTSWCAIKCAWRNILLWTLNTNDTFKTITRRTKLFGSRLKRGTVLKDKFHLKYIYYYLLFIYLFNVDTKPSRHCFGLSLAWDWQ